MYQRIGYISYSIHISYLCIIGRRGKKKIGKNDGWKRERKGKMVVGENNIKNKRDFKNKI